MPYNNLSPEDRQYLLDAQAGGFGPAPMEPGDPRLNSPVFGIPSVPQPGQPLVGPGAPQPPQPPAPPQLPTVDTSPAAVSAGKVTQEDADRINQQRQQGIGASVPPAPAPPPAKADMAKAFPLQQQQPQGAAQMQPQGGPAASFRPQQYAPAQTTPAHWVNTLSPDDQRRFDEAQAQKQRAIEEKADAEATLGEKQARIMSEGRDIAHTIYDRNIAEADRQRDAVMRHMDTLSRRSNQLAEERVTSYYDHLGTWDRVRVGIATALGAAGAALSHTENSAARLIEHQADQWVKAQAQRLENQKGAIEFDKGIYAEKLRLFQDKSKAEAAAKETFLRDVAQQAQEEALKMGRPQAKANADMLSADLASQSAELHRTYNKFIAPQTTGGPPSEDVLLKREKERAEIAKTYAEAGKVNAEGAGKDPLAKEHAQQAEAADKLQQIGQQVEAAPQTSFTHGHPLAYAAAKLGVQGTQGQEAKMAMDQWNSYTTFAEHDLGVRLGDPNKAAAFTGQVKIHPNDDAATRKKKIQLGMQLYGEGQGISQPSQAFNVPGMQRVGR